MQETLSSLKSRQVHYLWNGIFCLSNLLDFNDAKAVSSESDAESRFLTTIRCLAASY